MRSEPFTPLETYLHNKYSGHGPYYLSEVARIVLAERERCAKIAEDKADIGSDEQRALAQVIADAIRRGGEHEHNE